MYKIPYIGWTLSKKTTNSCSRTYNKNAVQTAVQVKLKIMLESLVWSKVSNSTLVEVDQKYRYLSTASFKALSIITYCSPRALSHTRALPELRRHKKKYLLCWQSWSIAYTTGRDEHTNELNGTPKQISSDSQVSTHAHIPWEVLFKLIDIVNESHLKTFEKSLFITFNYNTEKVLL